MSGSWVVLPNLEKGKALEVFFIGGVSRDRTHRGLVSHDNAFRSHHISLLHLLQADLF